MDTKIMRSLFGELDDILAVSKSANLDFTLLASRHIPSTPHFRVIYDLFLENGHKPTSIFFNNKFIKYYTFDYLSLRELGGSNFLYGDTAVISYILSSDKLDSDIKSFYAKFTSNIV